MRKVRRAIEGIDVPAVVAALVAEALLFAENVVGGPPRADALPNQRLGRAVAAVTRSASPLYSIFRC